MFSSFEIGYKLADESLSLDAWGDGNETVFGDLEAMRMYDLWPDADSEFVPPAAHERVELPDDCELKCYSAKDVVKLALVTEAMRLGLSSAGETGITVPDVIGGLIVGEQGFLVMSGLHAYRPVRFFPKVSREAFDNTKGMRDQICFDALKSVGFRTFGGRMPGQSKTLWPLGFEPKPEDGVMQSDQQVLVLDRVMFPSAYISGADHY